MEEEDDPFGVLVKLCRPTSSQEQKLQSCKFARESETFADAFDSLASSFSQTQAPPSQPPAIVMVSPPASEEEGGGGGGEFSMDENTPRANEEFLTPPEHHLPSSSSSHEDQARNPKPISAVDRKMEEGFGEDELGRENRGSPELEEMDGGGGDGGVRRADCLDGSGENKEGKSKKSRVFERELDERAKTIRVLVEKLYPNEDKVFIDMGPSEESKVDDDKGSEHGVIEISDDKVNRDMEVEKVIDGGSLGHASNQMEKEGTRVNNHEGLAVEDTDERLGNHGSAEVRKDGEEVSGFMDREDIDKFKYNGGGDGGKQCWKEVVRRRRALPLTIRGKSEEVGGKRKVGDLDVKNLCWKELLDVAAVFLNRVDDDSQDEVDFLEMAKRRGMTFPQPSWR